MRAVEDLLNLELVIVVEHNKSWSLVMSVQSDGHVVDHVSLCHKSLKSRQTWSLTDDGLAVDNGRVHPSCVVEDTECAVVSHINEVLSLDYDLGSAISRTARWLNC